MAKCEGRVVKARDGWLSARDGWLSARDGWLSRKRASLLRQNESRHPVKKTYRKKGRLAWRKAEKKVKGS